VAVAALADLVFGRARSALRTGLQLFLATVALVTVAVSVFFLVALAFVVVAVFLMVSIRIAARFEDVITSVSILARGADQRMLRTEALRMARETGKPPSVVASTMRYAAGRGTPPEDLPEVTRWSLKLSVIFDAQEHTCVDLLLLIRRFLRHSGSYEEIADRVTLAGQKGVPPEELRDALGALRQDAIVPETWSADEVLAAIITLSQSEIRGAQAGRGLAAVINGLLGLG